MKTIKIRSHVGRDGVVKLEIPTELTETDIDVVVMYQPAETPTHQPSPEELGWPSGFFEETAGQWQGEPLIRESQGEYEKREELQ